MKTHVDCAAIRYFRCQRLAATITPQQCRINRERCDALIPVIDFTALTLEEVRAPCFQCPQAEQVDAGRVRRFTIPQVVAGRALREPSAETLLWERRVAAQPDEHEVFTSHYWVPQ